MLIVIYLTGRANVTEQFNDRVFGRAVNRLVARMLLPSTKQPRICARRFVSSLFIVTNMPERFPYITYMLISVKREALEKAHICDTL